MNSISLDCSRLLLLIQDDQPEKLMYAHQQYLCYETALDPPTDDAITTTKPLLLKIFLGGFRHHMNFA